MKTTRPKDKDDDGDDEHNNNQLIPTEPQYQLLLDEIILNIARQGGWDMSGPLARCSKSMLKNFLQSGILIEIVDHLKKNPKNRMLKWLVLPLLSEFTLLPIGFDPIKIYESLAIRPGSWHEFITGGYVTQKIYGLQWLSDIDIYCHKEAYDNRFYDQSYQYSYDNEGRPTDHICSDTIHLEGVMEYFDISIVQQGYKHDRYYLTPLSLYTFYSKDIIVSPSNLNISYDVHIKIVEGNSRLERIASDLTLSAIRNRPRNVTLNRNIWHYIRIWHYNKKHNSGFDQCNRCLSKIADYNPIMRWCNRIEKYRKRFPDFTFTYCLPTTLHDIGDEEGDDEIENDEEYRR